MNAGVVIAARQNRYIRRFEEAGATEPARARSMTELGCDESWIFRRLESRGVIRTTEAGLYYLDVEAAQALRARRRARVLIVLLVVVTIVVILGWVL